MNAVMVDYERDGRVMSRMDPDTRMVHSMLEMWGRWAHDSSLRAYPVETIISRMMEYGALGAAQQGRPPISMPEGVARVDAAVARLGAIDKSAVVAYYTREEPIEVCARRTRMRVRQFQNVLRRARWRLRIILDCA